MGVTALFVLYCVVTSYYGRWTRHRAARKKKQAMEAANLKDKEQQGGQDAGDGYQPAEADKGKSDSEHSTKNGYQSVKTEEDDKIMSSSGSALGLYDGIPPQTQGSIETLPLYNPNHDKVYSHVFSMGAFFAQASGLFRVATTIYPGTLAVMSQCQCQLCHSSLPVSPGCTFWLYRLDGMVLLLPVTPYGLYC